MDKKKHTILTLIPSLYGGGAERFVADLSHSLANTYNHTILLYNKKKDKYSYSGNLIESTIPEQSGVISKIKRQFQILKAVTTVKKQIHPRITISHMLMANMLNIRSKKNSKVVCVLHGEWSFSSGHSKFLDWIIKRHYNRADTIVSVSRHLKSSFEKSYNLNVPHHVIPAGISIENVIEKSAEKTNVHLPEKYIVYVAGFRPVKNHIKLILQLELFLKKTECSLVFVGDGPLRDEIVKIIEERALSEKVVLLGNLPNPYPVLKKALLSIVASSSESFSLVVVESMALGVPVIATDCGGPREIITETSEKIIELPKLYEYGILIPKPDDWTKNSLVAEIEMLLSNEEVRNILVEQGHKRAAQFSIQNSQKAYELLINNLLRE